MIEQRGDKKTVTDGFDALLGFQGRRHDEKIFWVYNFLTFAMKLKIMRSQRKFVWKDKE